MCQTRSIRIRGFSIKGHNTATVEKTVDEAIITSVDMAGFRCVRRTCHAIQAHAPTTARMAKIVTQMCI